MVEPLPSKQDMPVRSRSPAPRNFRNPSPRHVGCAGNYRWIGKTAPMTVLRRKRLRVVRMVAAVVLLAATPSFARAATKFPKVTVTDVVRSKPFNLSELATAQRPVLVWFWAPH